MKYRSARLLPITLFLFLLIKPLSATEFNVSNSSQVADVMDLAQPGDTVSLANGIWKDQRVVFDADGSAELPILIRAKDPGQVQFQGRSNMRIGGDYLIVSGFLFIKGYSPSGAPIEFRSSSGNAKHSRLTNTAIVNYNPSKITTGYKWVSLYGQYNRVDHCYLYGKNHDGTTLVVWLANDSIEEYHTIDHNYFGYRPELGFNGGETIRIGTSTYSMDNSRCIVEYNYFEHCNGEAEIISNKSGENIYRYNTFYECEGALTLRHGNRATVESNFFFGNGNTRAGGVRVIGEDHKIFNNYFENLQGTGFRAAMPIMNGVPDSPLNRYFRVINAQIINNTFVNCRQNFILGFHADEELTLPPLNCTIANNSVLTDSDMSIFTVEDEPINMTYSANIMYGSTLGISPDTGITQIDPKYSLSGDGLYRPDMDSPLLNGSDTSFSFITDDFDGQSRPENWDIGADQDSEDPVIRVPIMAEDAGIDWEIPLQIYYVANGNELGNAIANARDGDTIELITSGGVYGLTKIYNIENSITIRGKSDLIAQPVISNIQPFLLTRGIFAIQDGVTFNMGNLILDGLSGTSTPANILIQTSVDPMEIGYTFFADNCTFKNADLNGSGHLFRANAGSFADTIKFSNCYFSNSSEEGILLTKPGDSQTKPPVSYLEIYNSTFWNFPGHSISINCNSNAAFRPNLFINHCTFDNCGSGEKEMILADSLGLTVIENSMFTNSSSSSFSLNIKGDSTSISYSNIFNAQPIALNPGVVLGDKMVSFDPLYSDPDNGLFNLDAASPARESGNDGKALGDTRWTDPLTDISDDDHMLPDDLTLFQNYPNPFNPNTTIRFNIAFASDVKVVIYDNLGRLVKVLLERKINSGTHKTTWDGTDHKGNDTASGIYFVAISVGNNQKVRKMILLR